jgi:hypothetical protein
LPDGHLPPHEEEAQKFAQVAIESGVWKSDDAAHVYCRARALPLVLRKAAPAVIQQNREKLRNHLSTVWRNVSLKEGSEGVRERETVNATDDKPTYPANTFHTFWALRLLKEAKNVGLDIPANIEDKRKIASLWSHLMLAHQVALEATRSVSFDANQLAWAIATKVQEGGLDASPTDTARQNADLVKAALSTFFRVQLPTGAWERYQPLFHYPNAGNAYCYTYETLTEILRPALVPENALYRRLLRPFAENLLRAWSNAEQSFVVRGSRKTVGGWSSGHHTQRTGLESWATAMVFSFLQSLRRLVGIWAREAAEQSLDARESKYTNPEKARKTLRERGRTWSSKGEWCVAEQMSSLFLNPVTAVTRRETVVDPDLPVLRDDQARSAILFGPPGTGKTTIVEALAGALGWKYIEIHASHFVLNGMDKVPGRADELFAYLMELDRCVVLFDEIDELLRERNTTGSDPFGRFLTTSMLPKLAKLWDQRRLLFFVNTNDITKADEAIKRSQRFDATVFVPPPAFSEKHAVLVDNLLGITIDPQFTQAYVEAKLEDGKEDGIFAVLRYDQLFQLVSIIKGHLGEEKEARLGILQDALKTMFDILKIEATKPGSQDGQLDPVNAFLELRKQSRRDFRKVRLFRLSKKVADLPKGYEEFKSEAGVFVAVPNEPATPVTLVSPSWSAVGDAVFFFDVKQTS